MSLQETAIKKVFEETGLQVEITGMLGDYQSQGQTTRYFTARRVGGTPEQMGCKTQANHLVPWGRARMAPADQRMLTDLRQRINDSDSDIGWPPMPVAAPQSADKDAAASA